MLLIMLLLLVGFQKYRDWDLNFFDDWVGLGNLLFDDFLNGVGDFDFFYLNHGIRFWHFDFFYNGIRDLFILGGNEKYLRFIENKIEAESFSSFQKSLESSSVQKLHRAFKCIEPLKYLLLHNFFYWIRNFLFYYLFYMDWIGLGNVDLVGFWLE